MATFSTILIDDEPFVMGDLSLVLDQTRLFSIMGSFGSIGQAFAYLREYGYVDFIFCDIQMEEMLGTEGVALLRSYTRFLILCTGYQERYAREAHQLRIDGFLEKPVEQEMVLALLERLQLRTPWQDDARFLFVRKPISLYQQVSSMECRKTDRRVREMVAVPIGKVVKMQRNGNEVDVFGLDSEGRYLLLGSIRTSLKTIYRQYLEQELFVCPNASVLYHIDYVESYNMNRLILKNRSVVEVSKLGRTYLKRLWLLKKTVK